jgi:hypothetical protein
MIKYCSFQPALQPSSAEEYTHPWHLPHTYKLHITHKCHANQKMGHTSPISTGKLGPNAKCVRKVSIRYAHTHTYISCLKYLICKIIQKYLRKKVVYNLKS